MSDGWKQQALIAAVGSLTAFNFYGGIDSTSTNKSQDKEIIQMKSELRDLWGKYNENAREKIDMGMRMADYMIEQERIHGDIERKISDVELEATKQWLESLQ